MCPQSNVNVVKDNKFCLLTKCGIVDTFQQSWKCFHHLFSNQRFFILKELYYHRPQTKMYSIWKKEQSLKNESYFSVWFYGLCLFDLELSQLTPKGAFFLTVQHSMQIIKWYFICHQCYYGYIVHCLWSKDMSTTHDSIVWISQESAEKGGFEIAVLPRWFDGDLMSITVLN